MAGEPEIVTEFTPGAPVTQQEYDTEHQEAPAGGGAYSGYGKRPLTDAGIEATPGAEVVNREYLPPAEPDKPFVRPEGATVKETNARGEVSIYTKDGVDYYTPYSTPWEQGYKTSLDKPKVELTGPRLIAKSKEGVETWTKEGPYEMGDSAVGPWVSVQKAGSDLPTHITHAEAKAIMSISGERQFERVKEVGLIPKEAVYVPEDKGWSYYVPPVKIEEPPTENKPIKEQKLFPVLLYPDKPELAASEQITAQKPFAYISATDLEDALKQPVNLTKTVKTAQEQFADAVRYLTLESTETLKANKAINKRISSHNAKWSQYADEGIPEEKQKEYSQNVLSINDNLKKLEKQINEDKNILLSGFELKRKPDTVFIIEGKTVKIPGDYDLTKLQKQGLALAEITVPFLASVRRASIVGPEETIVNIAVDAAALLVLYGVGRLAGKGVGALREVITPSGRALRALDKLAIKAGTAGEALTKAKLDMPLLEPLGGGTLTTPKASSALQHAAEASMKADRTFLDRLSNIPKISIDRLKKIETKSGLSGLTDSIVEIGKAQGRLERGWRTVESTTYNPEAKGKLQVHENELHLNALNEVQKAQAGLQTAFDKAGSVITPRYKPSPPAPEFRGYRMTFRKEPPITIEGDSATIKDIGKLFKEDRIHKTQAAIAEAETARKVKAGELSWKLETKPIWKEVAKETPIYKEPKSIPKKESVFPGIKESKKPMPVPIIKEHISPLERARVTGAKAEELYGSEDETDYVAKTIEEHMRALQFSPKITNEFQVAVRSVVSSAIEARNKAEKSSLTASQTKVAIKEAIKNELKQQPAFWSLPKSQIQATTKTALSIMMETIIKPPIKPPIKPLIPKPKVTLKFPSLQASDSERRAYIKRSKGSVAYRRGELGGKGVWHIWAYPFDKRIIVMGAAPEGATIVTGPGSAYKTIQSISGGRLGRSILEDTGAVDTRISTRGGKLDISFFRDKSVVPGGRPKGKITKR